jgi:hypothetical protein
VKPGVEVVVIRLAVRVESIEEFSEVVGDSLNERYFA